MPQSFNYTKNELRWRTGWVALEGSPIYGGAYWKVPALGWPRIVLSMSVNIVLNVFYRLRGFWNYTDVSDIPVISATGKGTFYP